MPCVSIVGNDVVVSQGRVDRPPVCIVIDPLLVSVLVANLTVVSNLLMEKQQ